MLTDVELLTAVFSFVVLDYELPELNTISVIKNPKINIIHISAGGYNSIHCVMVAISQFCLGAIRQSAVMTQFSYQP